MLFQDFILWGFYGLLGGCAIMIVSIAGSVRDSIQELNMKVAVVIEKVSSHDKRLDGLDEKVKELESEK